MTISPMVDVHVEPHGAKILFLDVDGPMIPLRMYVLGQLPGANGAMKRMDPVAVAIVVSVCTRANAKIVVSSSWATFGREECLDLFKSNGIYPTLIHEDWSTPRGVSPDEIECRRGRSDALAGHGPALFDGQYMIGYRRGRVEIGQPMEHKAASMDSDDRIGQRRRVAEIKAWLAKHPEVTHHAILDDADLQVCNLVRVSMDDGLLTKHHRKLEALFGLEGPPVAFKIVCRHDWEPIGGAGGFSCKVCDEEAFPGDKHCKWTASTDLEDDQEDS